MFILSMNLCQMRIKSQNTSYFCLLSIISTRFKKETSGPQYPCHKKNCKQVLFRNDQKRCIYTFDQNNFNLLIIMGHICCSTENHEET